MQATIKTVNEFGLKEIQQFLCENHKLGADHYGGGDEMTADMLWAWARDAEFQLSEGNDATIELKSWDSIHGRTQTYTISDDGLDSEIVEIEE